MPRTEGRDGPTCRHTFPSGSLERLTLAGRRALWTLTERSGSTTTVRIMTASLDDPAEQEVAVLFSDASSPRGAHLGAMAGDRSTLVYSRVEAEADGTVVGGGVWRVDGRSSTPIPGAPPAALVSASGGRVAMVPAARVDAAPRPEPGAQVEVRHAVTGELVSTFSPGGSVEAVALSVYFVAVLVEDSGERRIERYRVRTGAVLGATPVASDTAPTLDVARWWIVSRRGAGVRIVNAATGEDDLLAAAGTIPVGLSIERRRVAWAQNWGRTASAWQIFLPTELGSRIHLVDAAGGRAARLTTKSSTSVPLGRRTESGSPSPRLPGRSSLPRTSTSWAPAGPDRPG